MVEKDNPSFMSVGRDGVLPISLKKDDVPAIISSAYCVFEVENKNILLPEYLMMWLCRLEFDRQLSFYAGGDVRGGVNYEDFCEMPIIIPSIERQREIVAEYETLTRRIRLNEQIIQNLETTVQTLYRKMFVDGIDKENLPEGWRMGTIGEFCDIITGKKDVNESLSSGKYRFFSCSLDYFYSNDYIAKGPAVLIVGNGSYMGKVTYYDKEFDLYQRTYACIPKNDFPSLIPFLYCVLKFQFQEKYLGGSRGSSIPYIVRGDIADFEFVYNKAHVMQLLVEVEMILKYIQLKLEENKKIIELRSLLLVKMGQ